MAGTVPVERSILAHAYSPRTRNDDRQRPTWLFLLEHTKEIADLGWDVRHIPTGSEVATVGREVLFGMRTPRADDGSYDELVKMLWLEGRPFATLEQDVVPTLGHLRELAACPEEWCAVDYPLWNRSGHAKVRQALIGDREVFVCLSHQAGYESFRHVERGRLWNWRWGVTGDQWADYAGLGLTRFRASLLRRLRPAWKEGSWVDLDSRISRWLHGEGVRVHLHYPAAEHHHLPQVEGNVIEWTDYSRGMPVTRHIPIVEREELTAEEQAALEAYWKKYDEGAEAPSEKGSTRSGPR